MRSGLTVTRALRAVDEVGDAGIRRIEARIYISSFDDAARVRLPRVLEFPC